MHGNSFNVYGCVCACEEDIGSFTGPGEVGGGTRSFSCDFVNQSSLKMGLTLISCGCCGFALNIVVVLVACGVHVFDASLDSDSRGSMLLWLRSLRDRYYCTDSMP